MRFFAGGVAVPAALLLLFTTPLRAGDGGAQPDVESAAPAPEGVGLEQHLGAAVPLDLTFRDEIGRPVTLRDCVAGKPTLLVLAYYRCPMLCTEVMNDLLDAVRRLPETVGNEFNIVAVSFDPKERPTLAAAKFQAYTSEYGRAGNGKGWHFLTGDQPEIDALTAAVGFKYKWDAAHQQFDHPAVVMVLTPDGKLARYLLGLRYQPRAVKYALMEASDGKIGDPVDQVLLFCMHYDPKTGGYFLLVKRLIQGAGVLTVLAMGIGFVYLKRRERQRGPV